MLKTCCQTYHKCNARFLKYDRPFCAKQLYWSSTLRPATILKSVSNPGVFLWNLQNFQQHLFWRTSTNGCFYKNWAEINAGKYERSTFLESRDSWSFFVFIFNNNIKAISIGLKLIIKRVHLWVFLKENRIFKSKYKKLKKKKKKLSLLLLSIVLLSLLLLLTLLIFC